MTVYGDKAGGPPLKYTPEELEKKIVEYFEWVNDENVKRRLERFSNQKVKPYTISGICVYLKICKDTWAEYSKRDEFADSIKRAKVIVENYVEEGVLNGSLNSIGGIFNLKNNFGWVDKTDITISKEPEKLTADDIKKHLNDRKKLEINQGE